MKHTQPQQKVYNDIKQYQKIMIGGIGGGFAATALLILWAYLTITK